MLRRFISAVVATFLFLPLLAACTNVSDPTAGNEIRLYQVLPIAHKSKLVQAEGEGEAIAVVNVGNAAHTIEGWMVQTNAGKVILPKLTVEPGQKIYLANDAEYFKAYWNFTPNFEYGADTDKAVPDLKLPDKQVPILNDAGDVVRLLDSQGKLVDLLVYGNVGNAPAPWSGQPVRFVSSFPITVENQVFTRLKEGSQWKIATKADTWSGGTLTEPERVYFAGQTDFSVIKATGSMTLTAASAPDNAGPLLFDLVDKSKKSIRIVGYQFTNKELGQHLIAAVKRGVKVQVGIERNPGGSDMYDSDKEAHEMMVKGGVEVLYYYKWDGDLSTRYNPVHSKYAIFDEESVLVTSGNWTNSVFTTDTSCGNREWVLVVKNPDVVRMVKEVWDADWGSGHKEVRRWEEKLDRPQAPDTYDAGPCFPYTVVKQEPATVTTNATVTRILSPDNTMDEKTGFLGLLRNAREELLISANYINLWWGQAGRTDNLTAYPDPYITEIVAAARRGVQVKVLFDRRNVKLDSARDNHEAVKYLNDLAKKENLKLEARLVNMDGSGIGRTYHNKSLIVDGAAVVSSINGSENSFRYAREMALKVEGVPTVTGYFRDLFTHDWEASARPNQPWNVMAMPRNAGTFIDWSANAELDVTQYEVYYKSSASAAWQKLGTVKRPGFEDTHFAGIWGVVAISQSGARSDYALITR